MRDFRRPSPPTISDEAADQKTKDFLESVKGPINLRELQLFSVKITRRGETFYATLGPDNIANFDRNGRIQGLQRQIVVNYLVQRDGPGCAIRSAFCIMGDQPFRDPIHATIDHIKTARPGEIPDQHLRNLRLACAPCNSHYQKLQSLQWKLSLAPSGTQEREKPSHGQHPGILSPLEKERADAEIRINLDIYPVFCRWLGDEMDQSPRHEITAKHAIEAGAKYMRKTCGHGSLQSARNYLGMETSKEGSFELVEGMVRRRTVERKREGAAGKKGPSDSLSDTLTVMSPSRTEVSHD